MVVDRRAIGDYSIRAIVVDLGVAVGLPTEWVVGMIAGTMTLADAMAVASVHGIAGNWYSADDDSSVGLVAHLHVTLRMLALYPNDAMELEWVLAAVHGILERWAVENSRYAVPMRSVDLVVRKHF